MTSTIHPTPDQSSNKCLFNDCDAPAEEGMIKCSFHKNRRQCCVDNCTNQVYARKLCVRHGGKKQCQTENCKAHARGGGFCLHHGGFVIKRFCIVEGCSRQAHAKQKCVRHGGGRRCNVDGCSQHARAGGLCNRHSDGHECTVNGCTKTAQHSGSICFRHAMELRASGEAVPELSLVKGARSSVKRRKQQLYNLNHPQFLSQYIPTAPMSTSFGMNLPDAGVDPSFGMPMNMQQVQKMNMRGILSSAVQDMSFFSTAPPSWPNTPTFANSGEQSSQNSFSVGINMYENQGFMNNMGGDDLDAIIDSYLKFIHPKETAPIAYSQIQNQYYSPMINNIESLNVFDDKSKRGHGPQLHRMLSTTSLATEPSGNYVDQFFSEKNNLPVEQSMASNKVAAL